ncbi:MAG: CAAX protease [Proteobacteria bacterium]|nr:MAG: CAAX protease [Pseudomonadota bacterium]
MTPPLLPYCGAPPAPADWLAAWNLDPVLIAVWSGVGLACAASPALRARDAAGRRTRAAFAAGWSIALVAWISPLCALGVALFGVRVAQHMLLALVAAPLLAVGLPARAPGARHALAAGLAFAVATWLWHVPGPYEATFRSSALYWCMHATLLASAVATWRVLLARDAGVAAPSLLALASCFQMSLLGALLTFAPAPLFAPHLATTAAWGLSPLEDQQLGGLALWVPGCAVFLLAGVAPVARWIATRERIAASTAL